ncbi:MAG: hypothetical protein JWP08_2822 [Bryobacterales bacterium]|nr:hypothetical protein [Bryobacterales bacterium]
MTAFPRPSKMFYAQLEEGAEAWVCGNCSAVLLIN